MVPFRQDLAMEIGQEAWSARVLGLGQGVLHFAPSDFAVIVCLGLVVFHQREEIRLLATRQIERVGESFGTLHAQSSITTHHS
jgi:hypothetical protein